MGPSTGKGGAEAAKEVLCRNTWTSFHWLEAVDRCSKGSSLTFLSPNPLPRGTSMHTRGPRSLVMLLRPSVGEKGKSQNPGRACPRRPPGRGGGLGPRRPYCCDFRLLHPTIESPADPCVAMRRIFLLLVWGRCKGHIRVGPHGDRSSAGVGSPWLRPRAGTPKAGAVAEGRHINWQRYMIRFSLSYLPTAGVRQSAQSTRLSSSGKSGCFDIRLPLGARPPSSDRISQDPFANPCKPEKEDLRNNV